MTNKKKDLTELKFHEFVDVFAAGAADHDWTAGTPWTKLTRADKIVIKLEHEETPVHSGKKYRQPPRTTQLWPSTPWPPIPATQTAPTTAADVPSAGQALGSATLAVLASAAKMAGSHSFSHGTDIDGTSITPVRSSQDSDRLQLQPRAAEVSLNAITVAARKSRRTMLRSKAIIALLSPATSEKAAARDLRSRSS